VDDSDLSDEILQATAAALRVCAPPAAWDPGGLFMWSRLRKRR